MLHSSDFMSDDHVRLHVEASVVSVSSSLVFFFGNSVKKICTSAHLPYNNENTDSRSTSRL